MSPTGSESGRVPLAVRRLKRSEMSLKSAVGVRLVIFGDGKSTSLKLDLKKTIVQYLDGTFTLLPTIPTSIIRISAGGPDVSPEAVDLVVSAELEGGHLNLEFIRPLIYDPEPYTLEILFGFSGSPDSSPVVNT